MANEALSILTAFALLPGILAFAVAALAATFAYRGDSDIRALAQAAVGGDFRTLDPMVVRALRAALPVAERLQHDTGLRSALAEADRTLVDVLAPTFALATVPQGRPTMKEAA